MTDPLNATSTPKYGRRVNIGQAVWRKLTGEQEQGNLENLKTPDDTWKVRLIEEDFHSLIFEAQEV